MKRCYRSDIAATVHLGISRLHAHGLVDKATMREFDTSCLTPIPPFSAQRVRDLRERSGASQAVFAAHLAVTTKTLGQWERGEREPTSTAAKLLSLVEQHGLEYIR